MSGPATTHAQVARYLDLRPTGLEVPCLTCRQRVARGGHALELHPACACYLFDWPGSAKGSPAVRSTLGEPVELRYKGKTVGVRSGWIMRPPSRAARTSELRPEAPPQVRSLTEAIGRVMQRGQIHHQSLASQRR